MENKKCILIIEDEKDLVNILKLKINAAGSYDVIGAYDGQEGLNLAHNYMPDLIILDLMLPKINGYKVCRMLKFSDKYKHIPIIIYSARSQAEDKKLAQDCGADAYIPKMLGHEVLLDRIKKLLS